jgi:hypothetical protein
VKVTLSKRELQIIGLWIFGVAIAATGFGYVVYNTIANIYLTP